MARTLNSATLERLDAVINTALGQDETPDDEMFCSLDHVAEFPADHADPFMILATRERNEGIPLVFLRDCDIEIREHRRMALAESRKV